MDTKAIQTNPHLSSDNKLNPHHFNQSTSSNYLTPPMLFTFGKPITFNSNPINKNPKSFLINTNNYHHHKKKPIRNFKFKKSIHRIRSQNLLLSSTQFLKNNNNHHNLDHSNSNIYNDDDHVQIIKVDEIYHQYLNHNDFRHLSNHISESDDNEVLNMIKKNKIIQFEKVIPDSILLKIFEYQSKLVPDKYGFPSLMRTRYSDYGFSNSIDYDSNLWITKSSDLEPEEGLYWYTPPMSLRLVNRRWSVLAPQVFLRHLSVTNYSRIISLGLLFEESQHLANQVRSLTIDLRQEQNLNLIRSSLSDSIDQNQYEIQNRFWIKKLLKPCNLLRSLAVRKLPVAYLFPIHLNISDWFLPKSIIRLSIEFKYEHSKLITTIGNRLPSSKNSSSSDPIDKQLNSNLLLHSIELNLLLVSFPSLKSLIISNYHSTEQRPISKYHSSFSSKNHTTLINNDRLSQSDLSIRTKTCFNTLEELKILDSNLSIEDYDFILINLNPIKFKSLKIFQIHFNSINDHQEQETWFKNTFKFLYDFFTSKNQLQQQQDDDDSFLLQNFTFYLPYLFLNQISFNNFNFNHLYIFLSTLDHFQDLQTGSQKLKSLIEIIQQQQQRNSRITN